MGDTSSIWGGIISGLVSAYGQKKAKDKAKDQYKYQQQELERQRQYAEEMYRRRQNTPSARASSYLMEYYLPQIVDKMKKHNKGGDTSVLDRMLADIMGGISHNQSGSSYGTGQGGSNSFFSGSGSAQKEEDRKLGLVYVAGQVDPEIEGYNGKTWESRRGNPFLEGAASGGEWMGTSTAFGLGGPREVTRSMGNTTTQTERGYTVQHQPWNMIDEGSDIGVPNQQGELATGGTLNVATEGMDPQKLMLMGSMLGITKGPKGTTMGPNGTYGDGKFQASDIINWAQQHPWLWKIGKTLGNLVVPGAATVADAALRYGVSHGIGDGIPGNASIRRVYK